MRLRDNLRKALKLAGAARELAIDARRYNWEVASGATFYLQAEYADIRLARQDGQEISAKIELVAGFGWQLATDQDEAGVYIIARRKPLVGSIGRGKFDISLPADVHISLKLEHCLLCLVDLSASLDFPNFP